ncbi:MAG: DUF1995 family protein [Microcoleus sp. PH2017_01_SCD_O_A]|uniref:DUF1995 family protein n=1 Tax=unclassified Microcoleus TaxID=2642155 RepID=UPI001D6A4349|nr:MULTISPECIES: DUF1995 family protein [unclassified Microcoleus]TAE16865.1 MAG: DUF1995 family protein [Oscillatoriales cyanobacterium]MCC3422861.1 DUF1995 family protein [Microcoleus sp. PH2017_01_SCD_O_A]MCC3489027.1 DUF1995 family protein [Microcoleus sp. PH2017_16_JOR_D_A]MCC3514632.1 DUF1995 family protein [Microcoleus sp. PH2017_18_LLB_O_A]MCC3532712.1 DUF1995 family protein [Microcoleus sp. PH2017_25_DOB_D_A]
MTELPNDLNDAIAQSRIATAAALSDGMNLLQVELVFPEIALQAQSITQQFLPEFEESHSGMKVFFPDAGAAALARRDWGEVPFKISDLGSSRTPVEDNIAPEDQLFLLVNPAAVEVSQVEKLYIAAAGRPVILLNPRLEDVATIGIGYAGRQLRDRFLSKIESCYYIRPLDTAALFRCYPQPWQVWLEINDEYELISETAQKPVGDDLERILAKAMGVADPDSTAPAKPLKKKGFLAEMQTFLKALTQ